jgi:hypothetical protein
LNNEAVRLEVTEDYTIDEVGNATIMITYRYLNEKDEPILTSLKS